MKLGPLFAAVLLAGGVAGAAYWIKQVPAPPAAQGGRRGPQNAAAPVAVAQVIKQTVPVYREGIGNVQALNSVIVRAQVDGRLMSVGFSEGQDVKKGDILAQIDPVTFKAQYDQAVAKKAQDEANVANMRIDLERYRQLAKTNAGPKQQADQQAALVAQMEAQIQSDQGAIDNAKAILGYTTIAAPLDGRVGLRQVDPGNIVHASDANGIVLITQVKPVGVLFTLPQRDLAATMAAFARGNAAVEIPGSDGTSVEASGLLRSIDNQIDVTTGTIKLKAEFPNAELKLWPGQFVGVRVVVDTLADAKVVPASAIRRGIDGNFVYLVGEDSKAAVTKVTVALQNETIAVVSGGVAFGQTVVTEGFALLTDGKPVQISPGTAPKADAAAASPAGKDRPVNAETKDGKGEGRGRKREGAASQTGTADVPGDPPAGAKRERRRRDEAAADGAAVPAAAGVPNAKDARSTEQPGGQPKAQP